MKCRRAFDADLLAVLRGESGDGEFLAHYPSCPDCAAELRVWGELEAMLRVEAPASASHPPAEALLALVDAPATLAAATRGEVERHVAACHTCADEVGSLRRFDPGRLVVAADTAPLATATARAAPLAERSRGGWLGRLVWHPAFAYALVVALLVPVLRDQFNRVSVPVGALDLRRGERVQAPTGPLREPVPAAAPAAVALAPTEVARDGARNDAPVLAVQAAPAPPFLADERARKVVAPSERRRKAPEAESKGVVMDDASAAAQAPDLEKDEAVSERAVSAGRFADRKGLASGVAAAPAESPAAPLVLEVRAGAHTVIPLAVAEGGPLLRIVPPAGIGAGAAVDVQVRARAGVRELTEHLTRHANRIELQIPPRWLAPGDYTVTLTPAQVAPGGVAGEVRLAPAAATLGFTVGAPVAAEAAR